MLWPKLKSGIARGLCHPWIGMAIGAIFQDRIPSRDAHILTPTPPVDHATKASIYWGFYERAEIAAVHRWLQAGLPVVDLGASIGVVSAHVARRVSPGGRLVCVEPNAALHEVIRANVEANAPGTRLDVIGGAVAYDTGETTPFLAARRNIDSRVASGATEAGASVDVPTVHLAGLLQQQDIQDYALVMDIEGGEAGILFKDAEALAGCRVGVAELHQTTLDGKDISVEDLVQRLRHLGFEIHFRHGPVVAFSRTPGARSPAAASPAA